MMRRTRLAALVLPLLLLTSCQGNGSGEDLTVNAARKSVMAVVRLAALQSSLPRPASTLGIYVAMFLAQGQFLPVSAAREGIEVQMEILQSQTDAPLDDSFVLLQEFGGVLSVDISDLLNRSDDRSLTLNQYIDGLKNITERNQEEAMSLASTIKRLEGEQKEQRTAVRALQREIDDALDAKDYALSGTKQQELVSEQKKLADIETEKESVELTLDTFEELLGVAGKRIAAMEANREVLVAGLTVIDIPGVEDLKILDRPRRRGRSSGGGALPLLGL